MRRLPSAGVSRQVRAIGVAVLLAASSHALALGQSQVLIPSRNVNVISGTGPHGDWTLQRQNEPSMACSSRNPLNCFAVANDYRTVDIPFPQDDGRVIGDAWLGWYWTKNGGQSWRTRLLPGYPQDTSAIGQTSPLYINQYQAGADPVVRAGANGMFFYSGIAFRRGPGGGSTVFVARFIDNNNNENPDVPSIAYLDTTRIMSAPNGTVKNFFIDKPWIAVDIPRGSQTCNIGGGTTGVPLQPLPCSRVYVGFTVFQGPNEERGTVMLAVSEDSGRTWSKPQPVTPLDADVNNDGAVDNKDIQTWAKANRSVCQTPEYVWDADINVDCVVDSRDMVLITKNLQQKSVTVPTVPPVHQGVALGIVPSTGALRIAWRQFRTTSSPRPDEIQASISTDGGQTFAPPVTVSPLIPFDQRTTETTFRSNAFPTLAIDGDGRSYLAWTTRGIAKSGITGDSRIVLSTSMNGLGWSPPVPIDDSVLPGHQIMPSLSFASGRLQLVYYDEREDVSGVFENDIDEQDVLHTRHTTDVRVAQATAGPSPVFESVRVSDYAFGVLPGSDDVRQLEFDPPNLPIFRLGQAPFKGDYIDIVPSQSIVPNGTGWSFNTAPGTSPVFHAVWTDNRDVRPPANGDWSRYTPPVPSSFARPTISGFNPGEVLPACEPGFVATRNQNIYTSRITNGLFAAALGNAKPLGGIQRAFATYVQNGTSSRRSYRMSINTPPDVTASFNQFQSLLSLDVSVPARSTIARTVYVSGVNAQSSAVIVLVTEILNGAPVPGGQTTRIVLNPDSTNPDVDNPDVDNPDVDNPDVDNPDVDNPDVDNAEVYNPDVDNGVVVGQSNPDVDNPDVDNPDVDNVVVENPSIVATGLSNPDVDNPDVDNPDVDNPDVDNADLTNGALSDTTWQVSNFGNTSATYSVKMLLRRPLPEGFRSQLLVYRAYKTPVALGCSLKTETANVLIINMPDPPFFNAIAPTTNTAGAVTQSLASRLTRTRPLRRVSATGEPQLVAAAPNDIDPNDPNAEDVTVAIAPGESLRVTLRIFDPDRFDAVTYSPVTAVTPALAAHSLDTETAETNPGAAPEISVALITTESLPAATQNSPYSASLQAIGTGQWSVVGGALPTGFTLSPATGVISGTATVAANEVKFTVRFVGGDGAVDFKEFTIAVVATAAALADVSVSFTSAPATAIAGLPINYVMSVTNNSATMAAANVAIEQELPVGATFGSATPGCIYTTRVRCVLGALAPGGNVIIAVTATLSGAGPVVSKATVTTDTAESVILNNEQTAATNVQAYAACTAPTFSGPTLFPTNQFGGFQSVLGEVTGDAYKDIVLSSVTSPNVLILPARTDQIGLFGAPLTLPLSEAPQGVAVADLDKNGQNDIVVSANVGTYALFLRGLGGGAFASEVQIPLGDAAFVIDAADFNNDGNLDLVVGTDNGKLKTLTGDGFGGFGPPTTVHSGSQTLQFVIADYNNDGLLDLAASDRGTGDILLFQNTPGAPGAFSQQWSVNHGVGARARKVGDLNGDGLPDLEVTVSDFPTAQTLIYLSTGVGGFTGPLDANAGPAGIQPTAGDVTGDGIPDLVTASGAWGSIAVQAGIGDGTFAPPIHLAAKTFDIPKVMDINGDHRDDIVAVGGSPGFVQAFYNNCSSTTTDLRITTRSDTPDPVNAGALLTYQTTIANVSATTATGVVTNFALGGLTNATEAQSATSPQGSCAVVAKDHVRCSIASLPPSASATIQVTARSYAGGSSTLTMTSVTANQADSVPSDNWALMTTNVIAVPVTLTVTSTADDGVGSLRNAIRLANANASGATINFNIPGAGPHTIAPQTPLDLISRQVFIDGESQPGYITGITGPVVIIDGSNVTPVAAGLVLQSNATGTSAGSTVIGLGIVNWKAAGIRISVPQNTPTYTLNHNSIGVDPSGTIPGPNAIGIEVNSVANVLIGDNVLGDGNTIAYNTGAGVAVLNGGRASILPNRIFQNGGLGIDLGNNGVTANDTNDADVGPNTLQNFPIIVTATTDGDTTQVSGSLHTTPNTLGIPIQFFLSSSCDASGNGEGELFVDSVTGSTNGAGNFNFAITLFVDGTNKFVTATAGVFSSEFSNCMPITNTP